MNEKPIIFSAPMVRAILEGRKTQTRRVIKDTYGRDKFCKWVTELNGKPFYGVCLYRDSDVFLGEDGMHHMDAIYFKPRYKPGDLLWVRETWNFLKLTIMPEPEYWYKADMIGHENADDKWRSPIHMPRCASRITLSVTGIRCERVQDITEEDAKAEGLRGKAEFIELWDSLNRKRG